MGLGNDSVPSPSSHHNKPRSRTSRKELDDRRRAAPAKPFPHFVEVSHTICISAVQGQTIVTTENQASFLLSAALSDLETRGSPRN
eukprot:scaffold10399_cov113-Cylindrotheca_fusiformis.AAC.10